MSDSQRLGLLIDIHLVRKNANRWRARTAYCFSRPMESQICSTDMVAALGKLTLLYLMARQVWDSKKKRGYGPFVSNPGDLVPLPR